MPDQDPLAEAFGEGPAAALREEFARRNRTIAVEPGDRIPGGYTGAKLAAVWVGHDQADNPAVERCIAKVCPPTSGRPESARHAAALQHTYQQSFVEDHLVRIAFDPVRCPGGETIIGQRIAGGSLKKLCTLSRLQRAQLGKVCHTVRAGLLEDWTGPKYRLEPQTVPELLRCELRDDFTDWVVPSEVDWIITNEDGAMPNPLALLDDVRLHDPGSTRRLTGHSHGDLHFENVLVPRTSSGFARSDQFRLIDLSAFEPYAPLTRDPATLLVSILAHKVGDLDPTESEALLRYVHDVEQRPLEAPPDLAAVVDALSDPGDAPFAADWRDTWDEQLPVSVLAAAMLHVTYDSVGPTGRWWCLRLAGLLARRLSLVRGPRPDDQPLHLTSDMFGSDQTERRIASQTGRRKRPIINRDKEKASLRAALIDPGPAVIVVHGMAGVGKSALVDEVVAKLPAADLNVVKHDAAGIRRPDAMMLVEDIEDGAVDDRLRPGEWLRGRLVAAVDALDTRVAIVIDQADVLLDDESHTVVDDELDNALELLATHPGHPVRVVLVSRELPRSVRANTWPRNATQVQVHGLRQPYFGRFLARVDPDGDGLNALDGAQIETLRDRLQGNPSHASLAHIIVHSIDSGYGAGTLVEEVARRQPEEIPQFLADTLIEQLSDKPKLLLAALAAFGTPVEADAVAAVVKDRLPARNVAEMLQKLARQRVIEVNDGRYGLPPADPYRVLDSPPVGTQDWQKMLHTAARQLGFRLKNSADVHDVDDLYPHFALIDVLLRAQRYEAAHEMLEVTDQLLRRWDRELMLLGRREHIRERLEEPQRRMSNLNALGDLYAARGRFAEAAEAFQGALDIAARLDDPANRLRIQINMAAMHWEAADTEAAADLYSLALTETGMRADADAEDLMAASEGLADCYRRWGEYHEATKLAQRALMIARRTGSDRTVTIALKLARWHAETGDLTAAEEHIAMAETVADEQTDAALRTTCADAQADLLLDQDRPKEALALAEGVLAAARRQRSPIVLLQAQTIRCMAYLRLGEVGRAHEAIEAAERYRRPGRSLIVPAFRGLAAALSGNNDEAGRRFTELLNEAGERGRDPRDIGALQFLGYASCWPALTDDIALGAAAEHMRVARDQTRPAARGVEKLLTYLVLQLEECGARPGRLRPVLEAITGASREPGPA